MNLFLEIIMVYTRAF